MAKKQYSTTAEIIADQPAPLAQLLREASAVVQSAHEQLNEVVRWNSVAFQYSGEMKPFDPKLYLRDVVVFNIHRNYLLMVLPTGMRVQDKWNILEGKYTDGRRMISVKSQEELLEKKEAIQAVIRAWVDGVE